MSIRNGSYQMYVCRVVCQNLPSDALLVVSVFYSVAFDVRTITDVCAIYVLMIS